MIEQGTKDWLEFRKGKVTATKAAIIMGESPYQTPYQLFQEELGLSSPKESSPHMKKGLQIEDEAREWMKGNVGIDFFPDVVQHPKNAKFMASLDGISADRKCIIEIKNNNIEFHEQAKSGNIPLFHIMQINWQIYCSDAWVAFYVSYRKDDRFCVEVVRDDELINRMVEQANNFLLMVENLTPPPLTDKDYQPLYHETYRKYIKEYNEYNELALHYRKLADECKEKFIKQCGHKSSMGDGWKLTKYSVKGAVDYKRIPELVGVNLDQYRKPDTESYRLTLELY